MTAYKKYALFHFQITEPDLLRIKLPEPAVCMVPAQTDDWSCGHRTVLILNYLLKQLNQDSFCLERLTIPSHVVDEAALRTLCTKGVSGLLSKASTSPCSPAKDLQSVPRPLKTETPVPKPVPESQQVEHSEFSEEELSIICSEVKRMTIFNKFLSWLSDNSGPLEEGYEFGHPDNDRPLELDDFAAFMKEQGLPWDANDVLSKCSKKSSTTIPADRQPSQVPGKLKSKVPHDVSSQAPVKTVSKLEMEESKNLADLVPAADPLADQVAAVLESRPGKKEAKRRDAEAKSILKACGLDFNAHFQVRHKGIQVPKGHWKSFLEGIMGRADIDCPQCQCLIRDFNVDRIREQQSADPPTTPRKRKPEHTTGEGADADAVPMPAEGVMVPYDSPPKKKSRAGRPRLNQPPTFNLLEYLETSRPGVYRILETSEASDRLQKQLNREPSDKEVATEMKKMPVQCMLCGVFTHFPHISNTVALRLHEQTKNHTLAASREEHERSAKTCRGVCLPDHPDLLLTKKLDAVTKWYESGCISLTPSVLDPLVVVFWLGYVLFSLCGCYKL